MSANLNNSFKKFYKNLLKKPILTPTAAIVILGFLTRALHSWTYFGFKQMDEHWQVFEPAGGLIYGVWSKATEWQEGLRSWIYPGIVSLFIRAQAALNIQDPIAHVANVRLINGILSTACIWWSIKLAKNYCDHLPNQSNRLAKKLITLAPLAAGAWIALWPFAVYTGTHCHGDMVGAAFVLLAVMAIDKKPIRAGFWFGVALAIKIDLAIAGLFAGVWELLHLRYNRALKLAAGVAPLVFLVGLVDKLTWGVWFHNVIGHAHVNLVEKIGNQWGVSPWYDHTFYFLSFTGVVGLLSLFALPFGFKKLPEQMRRDWFITICFVACFSAIEHKEKRFISPILYVAIALSFVTAAQSFSIPYIKNLLTKKRRLRLFIMATATASFVLLVTDVKNYVFTRPWHDRVLALSAGANIPDAEAYFSLQWPAVFYFPKHIPSQNLTGTKEEIHQHAAPYNVVAVVHDGKHMSWWQEAGFDCQPYPHAPKPSKDPVPSAWRCERIR